MSGQRRVEKKKGSEVMKVKKRDDKNADKTSGGQERKEGVAVFMLSKIWLWKAAIKSM